MSDTHQETPDNLTLPQSDDMPPVLATPDLTADVTQPQVEDSDPSIKAGTTLARHNKAYLGMAHYAITQIDPTACNCPTPEGKSNQSLSQSNKNALGRAHSALLEMQPQGFVSNTNANGNASNQQEYINLENSTMTEDWQYTGIKALSSNRFGGYAMLWGDSNKPDLTGEYFSPQTEEIDVVLKAIGKLPSLYHHAMDGVVKTEVVGIIDTSRMDDMGWWVEGQLNKNARYRKEIMHLMNNNALGFSTGTLPGARQVGPDGQIKRWPVVEISMTPTPAEGRLMHEYPVSELKSFYKSIGIDLPQDLDPEAESEVTKSTGVEKTQDEVTKDDESNIKLRRILADLIKLELDHNI